MFEFSKLSIKQLAELSIVLSETKLLKKDFIKQKYSYNATNFEETLFFLNRLHLIKLKNNEISIDKRYKYFLNRYKDANFNIEILKKFFIRNVLFKKNFFSEYINAFLDNFTLNKNRNYRFKAKTSQKLQYSGIRNYLIELEFIKVDLINHEYLISSRYFERYMKYMDRKKVTFSEFKKILREKEKLGLKAELKIIQYEKDKLSELPFLLDKIEHISKYDIRAGFDIRSFESKLDKKNNPIPIYVEVKAVPIWSYEFYWTKNEINKAEFYKDRYY